MYAHVFIYIFERHIYSGPLLNLCRGIMFDSAPWAIYSAGIQISVMTASSFSTSDLIFVLSFQPIPLHISYMHLCFDL